MIKFILFDNERVYLQVYMMWYFTNLLKKIVIYNKRCLSRLRDFKTSNKHFKNHLAEFKKFCFPCNGADRLLNKDYLKLNDGGELLNP